LFDDELPTHDAWSESSTMLLHLSLVALLNMLEAHQAYWRGNPPGKQAELKIEFIQPGRPQQIAYIERYNLTVRYDWLAHYLFDSIEEVED
jgi:transposase InsO family protein